jgi:ATP phosphoribosyltransferase
MKISQNKKYRKLKKLKIAVPKGRVLKDALRFLRESGYIKHPDADYDSRKLIFDYEDDAVSLLIVKPLDVPTFVEYGAADAGIAGKDVLLEKPRNIYEPLDLGIGKCKVVVAARKTLILGKKNNNLNDEDSFPVIDDDIKNKIYYSGVNIGVATKYVRIARDFFNKKGVSNVQIIKLYGNVELAPISGLCDFIVDLVSTGETLRQNNLIPIEDIVHVTSRLIVNRASLKINSADIAALIEDLKERVNKNEGI